MIKIKNIKKNALICLAAGKSQIPVILKAKTLKYTLIAIDQNSKAPGLKYADIKINLSTHDSDLIIKELKKLRTKFKFIGILNRSSGPPVITSSKICNYFNIPGVPILSAKSIVNKDKMRSFCARQKIPVPKHKIYSIKKYKLHNNFSYPLVVKPALSLVGKSGVSIVHSKNKINLAIKYAEKSTINNKILVEEYLSGPDVSLISFVNDSKLFPICLLEEINIENNDGSISPKGYRTLKSKNKNLQKKATDIAKKIVSKFKIKRSAFMVSLRSNSRDKLKLIEIHLDIGGDLLIEAFFPKALPFDFLKLAVESAVGIAKYPSNFQITPTAIFYKDGVVSDKAYKVLTSKNNKLLDKKILKSKI